MKSLIKLLLVAALGLANNSQIFGANSFAYDGVEPDDFLAENLDRQLSIMSEEGDDIYTFDGTDFDNDCFEMAITDMEIINRMAFELKVAKLNSFSALSFHNRINKWQLLGIHYTQLFTDDIIANLNTEKQVLAQEGIKEAKEFAGKITQQTPKKPKKNAAQKQKSQAALLEEYKLSNILAELQAANDETAAQAAFEISTSSKVISRDQAFRALKHISKNNWTTPARRQALRKIKTFFNTEEQKIHMKKNAEARQTTASEAVEKSSQDHAALLARNLSARKLRAAKNEAEKLRKEKEFSALRSFSKTITSDDADCQGSWDNLHNGNYAESIKHIHNLLYFFGKELSLKTRLEIRKANRQQQYNISEINKATDAYLNPANGTVSVLGICRDNILKYFTVPEFESNLKLFDEPTMTALTNVILECSQAIIADTVSEIENFETNDEATAILVVMTQTLNQFSVYNTKYIKRKFPTLHTAVTRRILELKILIDSELAQLLEEYGIDLTVIDF